MTGLLAEQESVLFRLEITRETMTEILSGDVAVAEPAAVAASVAGNPDHRQPMDRVRRRSRPHPRRRHQQRRLPAVLVFHTHKERERLYPQPDQHNHELHA
ncbi:hypothetical protein ACFWDI_34070 [Streptomyces sp. NPDC060064]|uniref:hypothetical protein n=1 Tax=Streptomyces sp. NPDC060064 TaxID=3347049 RepID=UPI00368C58C2